MKIAKRTLRVTNEELAKLFNLPEEVEVMAVRKSDDKGFEFLLASAGEVFIGDTKITVERKNGELGEGRRITLPTLLNAKGISHWSDLTQSIEVKHWSESVQEAINEKSEDE